jgi:hypothetical protein
VQRGLGAPRGLPMASSTAPASVTSEGSWVKIESASPSSVSGSQSIAAPLAATSAAKAACSAAARAASKSSP